MVEGRPGPLGRIDGESSGNARLALLSRSIMLLLTFAALTVVVCSSLRLAKGSVSDLMSFCPKDSHSLQDSYRCPIISGLLMRFLLRAALSWQIIHTKSDMITSLLLNFEITSHFFFSSPMLNNNQSK